MVAIVGGNELGLASGIVGNTVGQTQFGQQPVTVNVNAATGNLVLQDQDGFLAGQGIDVRLTRTYNSSGQLGGDQGWMLGFTKTIALKNGAALNAPDSAVVMTQEDGSQVTFTYDAARGLYVSDDASAANGTISMGSGGWTYFDPSTQLTEAYDGQGRLSTISDTSGNVVTYKYGDSGLASITDANGDQFVFNYQNQLLQNIQQVLANGQSHILVTYGYYTNGQLNTVTTNDPATNAPLSQTTYAYYGGTDRIETLTQTDGTNLTFSYQQTTSGAWYVSRIQDGAGNVTTIQVNPSDPTATYTVTSAVNDAALNGTTVASGGVVSRVPGIVSQTGSAGLNSSALSTTQTITTNNDATVNGGALSTTEQVTTTVNDRLNVSAAQTQQPKQAGLNSGLLSTTVQTSTTSTSSQVAGALATTQTQTTTASAGLNNGPLSTTVTQQVTNTAALSTTGLTPASQNWQPTATLRTGGMTQNQQLVVDASGNMTSVWLQGSGLFASTFSIATHAWSAPVQVCSAPSADYVSMAESADGSKVVTWEATSGDPSNPTYTLYAIAQVQGIWQQPLTIATNSVGFNGGSPVVGNGGACVIAYQSPNETVGTMFTRILHGAIAGQVDAPGQDIGTLTGYAVDGAGNVTATWFPLGTSGASIVSQRYTSGTGWSSLANLPQTNADSTAYPGAIFNSAGDGILEWTGADGQLYGRTFDHVSGSWSAATLLSSTYGLDSNDLISVAINDSGNAVVSWVGQQGSSQCIAARVYANGKWGAEHAVSAAFTETSDGFSAVPTVSIASTGDVAVAWLVPVQGTTNTTSLMVAHTTHGVWSSQQQISTTAFVDVPPGVQIDAQGNVQLLWLNGQNPTKFATQTARLDANPNPHYVIKAGDSWASIAQSLYGTSSVASALQSAMGNEPLVTGGWLIGLPASLSYTATVTKTVAPYYTVQSGDTWASIAQTLYGTSAVAAQLQAALGNPTLNKGTMLSGMPASLSYQVTQTVTVAPYYTVKAGDSWASIAQAVYGTAAAAAALQTALGNAALSTGAKLTGFPAQLSYTVTQTITVPPYYTVKAGDTWATIATTLYGTAAAAASLQSALGNVALSTGTQLSGLPTTLQYSVTVAPYYVAKAGDTWSSITLALYGDSAAAAALQSAMGNPALTAGVSLANLPAALSYQSTQTITVAPYYTVQAGDTWASVAALLYGSSAAAGALQAAVGGSLVAGEQISGLPTTLHYTTQQTITVAPYYAIQAGDTWASIATTLYGTPEAATPLAAALGNPTLTPGAELSNLPATLGYRHIPAHHASGPYYEVQQGDTWALIAQLLYGTPDAASALQAALGNPSSLTAGDQLAVPESLTYSVTAGTTTITDPNGSAATYTYDGADRVVGVSQGVATAAGTLQQIQTAYQYDANGSLRSKTDANGNTTTYTYDAFGNLALVLSPMGETITYRYNTLGEVTAKITSQSTDGDGQAQIVSGTTEIARNVYDAQGRPRFAVSASGDVTEYRYNTFGQRVAEIAYPTAAYNVGALGLNDDIALTDIQNWAAAQDQTRTRLTSYSYLAGQLNTVTTYSTVASDGTGIGAMVTQYVYDPNGRLLSTTNANLGTSSYTYDALGRLKTSRDASGLTSTITYDDVNHKIATTLSTGLVTTQTYDADGRIVDTARADSTGTTLDEARTYYDGDGKVRASVDALGAVTWYFYDGAGRKEGQVDAAGDVTQYSYDPAGNLVQTTVYTSTVQTAGWMTTDPKTGRLVPDIASHTDLAQVIGVIGAKPASISSYQAYDADGRLAYSLDAKGLLIEYDYDGYGNLVTETQYASKVAPPATLSYDAMKQLSDAQASDTADNRRTDYVYDSDNRQIYKIGPSGTVTYTQYDAAGQVAQQTAYTQPLASTITRSTPMAANAVAQGVTPSANDQTMRYGYDAAGRQTIAIDGVGDVTQTSYDADGNVISKRVYASRTSLAQWDQNRTLTVSPSNTDQMTCWFYDSDNRLIYTVNGVGSVTGQVYDGAGRLSQQIQFNQPITPPAQALPSLYQLNNLRSPGNDIVQQYYYDVEGRQTFVVDGAQHVSATIYDADGRVVETARYVEHGTANYDYPWSASNDVGTPAFDTGAPVGNTAGAFAAADQVAQTVYDAVGRAAYSIDPAGQVTGYRYDALGQVTRTIAYSTNVTPLNQSAQPYTKAGLDALFAQVQPTDRVSQNIYDNAGQLAYTIDPMGDVVGYQYNVFGQLARKVEYAQPNTGDTSFATLSQVYGAPGANDRVAYSFYDQAGLLRFSVDAKGDAVGQYYDALGQLTLSVNFAGTSDLGWTTQTIANLISTYQAGTALNSTVGYTYDAAGNRISSENASTPDAPQQHIDYAFDTSGREISATDRATQAVTQNRYDTAGQLTDVIDADGNVTSYGYDTFGNRQTVILGNRLDASGNIARVGSSTGYTYDGDREQTSATDALGNVTSYQFDGLGQRHTAQDALQQTTTNNYDLDGRLKTSFNARNNSLSTTYTSFGQVSTRTDADGTHTSYNYYDNDGRLVLNVDATGAATRYQYDAFGDLVQTTQYANLVQDAQANVQPSVIPNSRYDRNSYKVYNTQGQLAYTIDGNGGVVENDYDAKGNLVATIAYAALNTLDVTTPPTIADMQALTHGGTFEGQASAGIADAATDRRTDYIYDANDRVQYVVDPMGYVTQNWYNDAGQVLKTTTYGFAAMGLDRSKALTEQDVAARLNDSDQQVDTTTQYKYDRAGLLIQHIDNAGNVTRYGYDAQGRRNVVIDGVVSIKGADEMGSMTLTSYDAAGNVICTRTFAQPIDVTKWDADQTVRPALDPNDKVLYSFYDVDNRLQYTVDGSGAVTQNTYDTAGNLITVIEYAQQMSLSGGQPPAVADLANYFNLVGVAPAGREIQQYTYDANGWRLFRVDTVDGPNGTDLGNVTGYSYDGDGRVTQTVQYAEQYQYLPTHGGGLWSNGGYGGDIGGYGGGIGGYGGDIGGYGGGIGGYGGDIGGYGGGIGGYGGGIGGYGGSITGSTSMPSDVDSELDMTAYAQSGSDDHITTTRYDAFGDVNYQLDAAGDATGRKYDANGNLIEITRYGQLYATGTPSMFAAAAAGGGGSTGLDEHAYYQYTRFNQVQTVADDAEAEAGTQTTNQYDRDGNLIQSTDALGNTTQYRYNARGQMIEQINPDGGMTLTRYDDAGRVLVTATVNSPIFAGLPGNVVLTPTGVDYIDTQNGSLVSLTGSSNFAAIVAASPDFAAAWGARYGYNVNGTVPTKLTADWNATWLINVPTALATGPTALTLLSSNYYDAAGRLLKAIDNNGHAEYYFYDALGQKVAYVNKLGGTTAYQYDAAGRLTDEIYNTVVPGDAQVNTYAKQDNLVIASQVGTASVRTHYRYDAFGNLTDRYKDYQGPSEQWTQFSYDRLNRQEAMWQPAFNAGYAVTNAGDNQRMQKDWTSFWDNAGGTFNPGGIYNLVGGTYNERFSFDVNGQHYGTLVRIDSTTANFVGNDGSSVLIHSTDQFVDLASRSPDLAAALQAVYGYTIAATNAPPGYAVPAALTTDWNGLWTWANDASRNVGDVETLWGGTITYLGLDTVSYTDSSNNTVYMNHDSAASMQNADLLQKLTGYAQQNSTLASAWQSQYSFTVPSQPGYQQTSTADTTAMDQALTNYWDNYVAGTPIPFGYGTITINIGVNDAGTYTDPTGQTFAVRRNMSVYQLAALSPYIAQYLQANYNVISPNAFSDHDNIAIARGDYDSLVKSWGALWSNTPPYAQLSYAGVTFQQTGTDTATVNGIAIERNMTPVDLALAVPALASYWDKTFGFRVFSDAGIDVAGLTRYGATDSQGDGIVSDNGIQITGNPGGETINYVYTVPIPGYSSAQGPLMDALNGWSNFWNQVKPGQEFAFIGGVAICNADSSVTFITRNGDKQGNIYTFRHGTTLEAACLASPEIAKHYQQAFGVYFATPTNSIGGQAAAAAQTNPYTVTPTTQTHYDVFGNAVSYVDVGGNYSYKSYDADGRVIYSVDADGNVQKHVYDAFGNQTQLISYANRIVLANNAAGYSTDEISVAVENAGRDGVQNQDRTITTTYDQENHVLNTKEDEVHDYEPALVNGTVPAATTVGPTTTHNGAFGVVVDGRGDSAQTTNIYNGAGQLIETQVNVSGGGAITADTYFYYDSMGRKIGTIDPMGYLTTWNYDHQGNVTREMQFACRLPAGFQIDTSPAGFGAALSAVVGATTALIGQNDNGGMLTATEAAIVANPAKIVDYSYDAMGNQTSSSNVVLASNDGTGSVDQKLLYAEGLFDAASLAAQNHAADPAQHLPATSAVDGITGTVVQATTITAYDAAGNKIGVTDDHGNKSYFTYDVLGQLRYSAIATGGNGGDSDLYTLTAVQYNDLGQATTTTTYGAAVNETTAKADIGFGSQVLPAMAPTVGSVDKVETDTYDSAGHLIRKTDTAGNGAAIAGVSGSGTSEEDMVYDVYGRVIEDWRSNVTLTGGDSNNANATTTPTNQTTYYTYDNIGQQTDTQVLQAQAYPNSATNGVAAPAPKLNDTHVDYNAFGEVTDRSLNGIQTASYRYDNEGRVWESIENGVATAHYYNAAGWQTAQAVSTDSRVADRPSTDEDTVYGYLFGSDRFGDALRQNLLQSDPNIRVSYTDYNLDGQVTGQAAPAFTDTLPGVGQQFGGDGSLVTDVTDAGGIIGKLNLLGYTGVETYTNTLSGTGDIPQVQSASGYATTAIWGNDLVGAVTAANPSVSADTPVTVTWLMSDGSTITATAKLGDCKAAGKTNNVTPFTSTMSVSRVTVMLSTSLTDPTLAGKIIDVADSSTAAPSGNLSAAMDTSANLAGTDTPEWSTPLSASWDSSIGQALALDPSTKVQVTWTIVGISGDQQVVTLDGPVALTDGKALATGLTSKQVDHLTSCTVSVVGGPDDGLTLMTYPNNSGTSASGALAGAPVLRYPSEIAGQGEVWLRVRAFDSNDTWTIIPPSGYDNTGNAINKGITTVLLDRLGIPEAQRFEAQMVTMMPGQALGQEDINADHSRISAITTFSIFNGGDGFYSILYPVNGNAFGNGSGLSNIVTQVSGKSYDRWGDVITSTDALGNTTSYTYNELGEQTSTTSAAVWSVDEHGKATLGSTTQRSFYDMDGNLVESVDGDGHVKGTIYNSFNQRVADFHLGSDSTTGITYDTEYQYNGLGQLGGKIDNLVTPLTGNAASDIQNYVGAINYNYNALGELTQTLQTDNIDTVQQDGSYVETENTIVTDYQYDQVGQRILTRKFFQVNPGQDVSGGNELDQHTYYDTLGNVVAAQNTQLTAGAESNGVLTETEYDAEGHKTAQYTPTAVIAGQYVKANLQTWNYDLGTGELLSHTDLGGNASTYTYDNTGELNRVVHTVVQQVEPTATQPTPSNPQVVATVIQDYFYDDAGHLTAEISQTGQPSDANYAVDSQAYRYDADGREIWSTYYDHSKLISDGTGQYPFIDPNGVFSWKKGSSYLVPSWSQSTSYDAMGRVTNVADDATSMAYYYDANSNRRAVLGATLQFNGWNAYQYWYAYDALNRQTISEGVLTKDSIGEQATSAYTVQQNVQSGVLLRDAIPGNEVTDDAVTGDEDVQQTTLGADSGETVQSGQIGFADAQRAWTNGDDGGLASGGSRIIYEGSSNLASTIVESNTAHDGLGGPGWTGAATNIGEGYVYDSLGQLVSYDYSGLNSPTGLTVTRTYDYAGRIVADNNHGDVALMTSTFDADSHELTRQGYDATYMNGVTESTTYHYNLLQGDNLDQYTDTKTEDFPAPNSDSRPQVTTLTYAGYDNYVLTSQQTVKSTGGSIDGAGLLHPFADSPLVNSSTYTVNNLGNVIGEQTQAAAPDANHPPANISFTVDQQGRTVLSSYAKADGSTPTTAPEQYLYIGQNTVGSSGSLNEFPDFDYQHQPLNEGSIPTSGSSSYVVNSGDTLGSIAASVYGDAKLWYLIADANGLVGGTATLTAGQTLIIPSAATAANNSGTFKPYDANNIIAHSSPLPPMPQPTDGQSDCGTFEQVLVMAVALVVAVETGVYVSGLMGGAGTLAGAVVGGAAGAAAGDAAGQAAANAFHLTNKFDLEEVFNAGAKGAIGGAVGYGVGVAFGGAAAGPGEALLRGALTAAGSAGIDSVLGLGHFSWADVAAASLASGAEYEAGATGTDPVSNLKRGLISGAAELVTHADGHINGLALAANVFGEVLGNDLAYQVNSVPLSNGNVLNASTGQVYQNASTRSGNNSIDSFFNDGGSVGSVANSGNNFAAEQQANNIAAATASAANANLSLQSGGDYVDTDMFGRQAAGLRYAQFIDGVPSTTDVGSITATAPDLSKAFSASERSALQSMNGSGNVLYYTADGNEGSDVVAEINGQQYRPGFGTNGTEVYPLPPQPQPTFTQLTDPAPGAAPQLSAFDKYVVGPAEANLTIATGMLSGLMSGPATAVAKWTGQIPAGMSDDAFMSGMANNATYHPRTAAGQNSLSIFSDIVGGLPLDYLNALGPEMNTINVLTGPALAQAGTLRLVAGSTDVALPQSSWAGQWVNATRTSVVEGDGAAIVTVPTLTLKSGFATDSGSTFLSQPYELPWAPPASNVTLNTASGEINFGLPNGLGGLVNRAESGVTWSSTGVGIQAQGLPFESWITSQLPSDAINLNQFKTNFKAFDNFIPSTGEGISVKTLDTGAPSYQNPSQVTNTLNSYVDQMANFKGDNAQSFVLTPDMIASKTMQLGVPATTNPVQWMAIKASINYAQQNGINVVVTQLR